MALQTLEIKGYKSLQQVSLKLDKLNVLIGPNGAGKTNLISFFKLLNEMVEARLQLSVQEAGGADSILFLGSKNTDKLEIKLSWGVNSYSASLHPTSDDSLVFAHESASFQGYKAPPPFTEILGQGHRESNLPSSKERVCEYVLNHMRSWRIYHFHDTGDSAKVKKYGDVNDNFFLRTDASNLAAFLFRLKEQNAESFEAIKRTVELVAPFFRDFVLRPGTNDKIKLEWFEKASDFPFQSYHLSDGTLRFICLATVLLQPHLPTTILIDEPELGLHHYAISVLSSLIHSASSRCQLIVSTQSVELLNEFSPQDVVVVDKLELNSTFSRLNPSVLERWLERYSLGDLWKKNILGGRPTRS